MSKSLHLDLHDENATLALGATLADVAVDIARSDGLIVFLQGDLGAGKTTLTRGLLRALGIGGAVKSPTYTLVEPYTASGLAIYHFDLYRLRDSEELEFMGVRDYFQPGSLCVIEWPERGGEFLPNPDIVFNIQVVECGRQAQISPISAAGGLLFSWLNAKNIKNISSL